MWTGLISVVGTETQIPQKPLLKLETRKALSRYPWSGTGARSVFWGSVDRDGWEPDTLAVWFLGEQEGKKTLESHSRHRDQPGSGCMDLRPIYCCWLQVNDMQVCLIGRWDGLRGKVMERYRDAEANDRSIVTISHKHSRNQGKYLRM